MLERVESDFLDEVCIFGKCGEQRDVLVDCTGEVVEAGECRNEAATQERDVLLAGIDGEAGRGTGGVELCEVEPAEGRRRRGRGRSWWR